MAALAFWAAMSALPALHAASASFTSAVAFFTSADDSRDLAAAERETLRAARRAGADLLISYGALGAATAE